MNAKRVLELGTATGYSAIWMARALSETEGKMITIEWDEKTGIRARKNIDDAGFSRIVTVISGDAKNVLSDLDGGQFDMIFQDVDKEMYSEMLGSCVKVLRSGGLLICDNTAFLSAGDFLEKSLEHPELDGFHLYGFLPGHGPEFDALTFLIRK
jgi:predicted O-methyltransferase YrrM